MAAAASHEFPITTKLLFGILTYQVIILTPSLQFPPNEYLFPYISKADKHLELLPLPSEGRLQPHQDQNPAGKSGRKSALRSISRAQSGRSPTKPTGVNFSVRFPTALILYIERLTCLPPISSSVARSHQVGGGITNEA